MKFSINYCNQTRFTRIIIDDLVRQILRSKSEKITIFSLFSDFNLNICRIKSSNSVIYNNYSRSSRVYSTIGEFIPFNHD